MNNTPAKERMNVQLPPNSATRSASRYPNVRFRSNSTFGFSERVSCSRSVRRTSRSRAESSPFFGLQRIFDVFRPEAIQAGEAHDAVRGPGGVILPDEAADGGPHHLAVQQFGSGKRFPAERTGVRVGIRRPHGALSAIHKDYLQVVLTVLWMLTVPRPQVVPRPAPR